MGSVLLCARCRETISPVRRLNLRDELSDPFYPPHVCKPAPSPPRLAVEEESAFLKRQLALMATEYAPVTNAQVPRELADRRPVMDDVIPETCSDRGCDGTGCDLFGCKETCGGTCSSDGNGNAYCPSEQGDECLLARAERVPSSPCRKKHGHSAKCRPSSSPTETPAKKCNCSTAKCVWHGRCNTKLLMRDRNLDPAPAAPVARTPAVTSPRLFGRQADSDRFFHIGKAGVIFVPDDTYTEGGFRPGLNVIGGTRAEAEHALLERACDDEDVRKAVKGLGVKFGCTAGFASLHATWTDEHGTRQRWERGQ